MNVAVLVMLFPPCSAATTPVRVSVAVSSLASDGMVQSGAVYVPADVVTLVPVSPAGTGSLIITLLATLGPRLVTVTVNVTTSPTSAVPGLTSFFTSISTSSVSYTHLTLPTNSVGYSSLVDVNVE